MTAFDGAKIDDFKLEEVASGVNNVNNSVSLDGQATFVLGSITQAGPFFPCQNVSRENEESLLNLKIESDSTRQDERSKTIHNIFIDVFKNLFEDEATVLDKKALARCSLRTR